jgi:hypothetical protein
MKITQGNDNLGTKGWLLDWSCPDGPFIFLRPEQLGALIDMLARTGLVRRK